MLAPKTQTPKPLAPPPPPPHQEPSLLSKLGGAAAAIMRKMILEPTAETSSTLRRHKMYPGRLQKMEVYSSKFNNGKPPPARCNGDMTAAPEGQLPPEIVAVSDFDGRPCPCCPPDRNFFTTIIGNCTVNTPAT